MSTNEVFSGLHIGGMPHRESVGQVLAWLNELPEPVQHSSGGAVVTCMPLRDHEYDALRACYGARHHGLPFTDDIQAPSIRELQIIRDAIQVVRSYRLKQLPVLVLCREGKNRSGVVVAGAIRALYWWAPEAAVERVRERRPGALYNTFFVDALLRGDLP